MVSQKTVYIRAMFIPKISLNESALQQIITDGKALDKGSEWSSQLQRSHLLHNVCKSFVDTPEMNPW